jgi:hypothetical protein
MYYGTAGRHSVWRKSFSRLSPWGVAPRVRVCNIYLPQLLKSCSSTPTPEVFDQKSISLISWCVLPKLTHQRRMAFFACLRKDSHYAHLLSVIRIGDKRRRCVPSEPRGTKASSRLNTAPNLRMSCRLRVISDLRTYSGCRAGLEGAQKGIKPSSIVTYPIPPTPRGCDIATQKVHLPPHESRRKSHSVKHHDWRGAVCDVNILLLYITYLSCYIPVVRLLSTVLIFSPS